MQPSECKQWNSTKCMQPSECNKINIFKWMQPNESNEINATNWMQSAFNKVNVTNATKCKYAFMHSCIYAPMLECNHETQLQLISV